MTYSSLAQLVERKTVNLEANSSTLLGRVSLLLLGISSSTTTVGMLQYKPFLILQPTTDDKKTIRFSMWGPPATDDNKTIRFPLWGPLWICPSFLTCSTTISLDPTTNTGTEPVNVRDCCRVAIRRRAVTVEYIAAVKVRLSTGCNETISDIRDLEFDFDSAFGGETALTPSTSSMNLN
jgi:hypothetical protein